MCTLEGLPEMSMNEQFLLSVRIVPSVYVRGLGGRDVYEFLLSVLSYTAYVYARGLARDVNETVPSVTVILHRMCTLEGLPEMSMKQFLLSVLSMQCMWGLPEMSKNICPNAIDNEINYFC